MNKLILLFKNKKLTHFLTITFAALLLSACQEASSVAHKIKQRILPSQHVAKPSPPVDIKMVSGVKVSLDVAYGNHPKQRMDVYAPENANLGSIKGAPVIMMLHGGGWATGSKNDALIYINKVNRWVPKGFIVISVGTRLLPDADVYGQVSDFSQAVAFAQQHAHDWGGDAEKFILMGHSTGGTIVSTLSANPTLVTTLGGKPWLGTFSLDSSSLDIPRSMRLWHPEMIQAAYGKNPDQWPNASPIDLLSSHSIPMFIACSLYRPDSSCEQAQLFKEKAQPFNIKITISPQKLNHGDINDKLGLDSDYTKSAETFMAELDKDIAKLLANH